MAEEKFFFRKAENGEWVIKEELVTDKAKEIAKNFVKEGMERNQLRKFYMEVKSLERKVEAEGFEKIKPFIKMLKAKVNYQRGRKTEGKKLVTDGFVNFISECVDHVNSEDDLKAFVKYFEAVVGYYFGELSQR
jgi:CRISPR-associated protein Csm2